MSQLDLAMEAEISARHLSFLETGRSQPSRDMLLHLAEQLEIPLRERNVLLNAAGFASVFPERQLADPALDVVRKAIDVVLTGHNPFPAFAVEAIRLGINSTLSLPLTVKGVLKDIPFNSTIHFDFLKNFDNQLKPDGTKILADDWAWLLDAAFFSIPDAANATRLEKEMTKYLPLQNKASEDSKVSAFKLVTIRQNAAWNDVISANSLYRRPDDAATYGGLVLAILICLSACLNFSNTTVARANKRLKEIGMRKVMGSTQAQLIGQLLMECSIIVLASIFLSILFNSWWLPTSIDAWR